MDPVVTLKCRTRMVAVTMIVGVLVVTVVVTAVVMAVVMAVTHVPASSAMKKVTWRAIVPTQTLDHLADLWSATSATRRVTWRVIAQLPAQTITLDAAESATSAIRKVTSPVIALALKEVTVSASVSPTSVLAGRMTMVAIPALVVKKPKRLAQGVAGVPPTTTPLTQTGTLAWVLRADGVRTTRELYGKLWPALKRQFILITPVDRRSPKN